MLSNDAAAWVMMSKEKPIPWGLLILRQLKDREGQGWSRSLWEPAGKANKAFAAQTSAVAKELGFPKMKVSALQNHPVS